MKKTISLLCVVLVVGFAGTAFAKKMPKVDVCHNGSVYIGDTDEDINGAPPLNMTRMLGWMGLSLSISAGML